MGTIVDFASVKRDVTKPTSAATAHCRPHTVRLEQPAEQAYWCRHFRATPERLSSVIREVGSNPAIVQLHLYRR
jgi:hypothetical protein